MCRAASRRGFPRYASLFVVFGGLFAAIDVAAAQTPAPPSHLTFSDAAPAPAANANTVVRDSNGTTEVKIAMTASPDTVYQVFLKCVRQLGDVTTGDEGVGIAVFSFPSNIAGNVFAFDVYPNGAPAGNKFQSVQVAFK